MADGREEREELAKRMEREQAQERHDLLEPDEVNDWEPERRDS